MVSQKRSLQAPSGLSAGAENGVDRIWKMQLRKEHDYLLAKLENLEESMKRFKEVDTAREQEIAERFILLEGQMSKQGHGLELIRQEYKKWMEADWAKMKEEFAADWKQTHSNASASTIAEDDEVQIVSPPTCNGNTTAPPPAGTSTIVGTTNDPPRSASPIENSPNKSKRAKTTHSSNDPATPTVLASGRVLRSAIRDPVLDPNNIPRLDPPTANVSTQKNRKSPPATRAHVRKLSAQRGPVQQDQAQQAPVQQTSVQQAPIQQAPVQQNPIQSKQKLDRLSQGRASFSEYFTSAAKKIGKIPADREVEFIGLFVIGMTNKGEREKLGVYLCRKYQSRKLKNGITEFDCYWGGLEAAVKVTRLL